MTDYNSQPEQNHVNKTIWSNTVIYGTPGAAKGSVENLKNKKKILGLER